MSIHPQPKPRTRKQLKARKDRNEAAIKRLIRAACEVRDGHCRYGRYRAPETPCAGPSEWAHMDEKRRSKTRGMKPEVRHTTTDSLMLCRRHHAQYDNKIKPRLWIRQLDANGADGSLMFIQD